MWVMRREARREGRHVLKSAALIGGVVLTCGLLAFRVVSGWSAEPPMSSEHHHHPAVTPPQKTMVQPGGPVKQQSDLAMPKGWQFAMPAGNHHAGRQVFIDFECFKCHEVRGEDFPSPKAEQGDVGSVLSGMGAMHTAEYFVEVMIDPNASVAWRINHHKSENKGYLGPDGKSKMPSYNDSMTIQQLIDVVAYMKSLTAGAHAH